jgi:diguanylate cyclase (GGDEF)-like protein/PAS domain S-box-containing protein
MKLMGRASNAANQSGTRSMNGIVSIFSGDRHNTVENKVSLADSIQDLPVGVFILDFSSPDADACFGYFNRRFAKIVGVSVEELILEPMRFLRALHSNDLERLRHTLADTKARGVEQRLELRANCVGVSRVIGICASVHMAENGHCVVSGRCWDEQSPATASQAQSALSERDPSDQLRLQSDFLPIGLIASRGDDNLTITEWNSAAERIFGYSRQEAIGKSPFDLIVLKEDWEFVKTVVRPAEDLSQGSSSKSRNVRKDGRVIWCRWFSTFSYDANGAVTGRTAMVQDITDQVQNEERMRLWGSVIQQSMEAIIVCDARLRIVLVNKAFEDITGYSEAEAVGQTPRILHSGRQDRAFYVQMWNSVVQTDQWRGEIWNRRKNGELYMEWLSLTAARGLAGEVTHYIGVFSDITQRKQTEERIQRLAHFDALTGIPNRSLLIDRAGQLLAAARRNGGQVALLFVDLDRFKNINDSMGHEAGDELLKTIATRLQGLVRQSDTVARMGGDEFVIVMAGVSELGDVARLSESVLNAIAAPLSLRGQEVAVTGSVGVCVFPNDAEDVSEMIRNADAAMYRAKEHGRNAYQFYTRSMNDRALEILATETALRHALQRNEFELHYQPQFCAGTERIVGAEALIRWNRPGMGLVSPGTFIPIAEERGLIAAIGQWTLQEAARQAAEWDRAGYPPLPIAVNLSATEFHQTGFVGRIADTLLQHGLKPDRIELEITEGIIVRDADSTIEILECLHDLGVKLSIDDFGTGYSSLNYLRRFPIDKIKIDQSFVREMMDDTGASGIVLGVIGLAKSLGLEVVAEGVETTEQLRFLRAAHCDFVQGFLLGRALPAGAFELLLQSLQRDVDD